MSDRFFEGDIVLSGIRALPGSPGGSVFSPFQSSLSPVQDDSLYQQVSNSGDDESFHSAADGASDTSAVRDVMFGLSRDDAQSILERTLPSHMHERSSHSIGIPALLDKYDGKYENLVRLAELKYGTPQPGDTLDGSVIREQSDDPTVIFPGRTPVARTPLGFVPLLSDANRRIANAYQTTLGNVVGTIEGAEEGVKALARDLAREGAEEARTLRNIYRAVEPVVRPVISAIVAGAKANAAQPRMGMVPIDPALVNNRSPSVGVVAPLIRPVISAIVAGAKDLALFQPRMGMGPIDPNSAQSTSAVAPLVRTVSRAPAVDVRGEDDPAIVIDATKQTGDDMPPTRTSSMRPEVAKRELEQIIRSSSEPEPVKARLIAEIDESVAKFTRRGVDPERLVIHMRRQLSSAVSARDSPGASTPIKQVAQHSLLAPTTSAPTPRSSTPPPASPEPAISQSNVVRSTQRNGHSLVTVDSNASFQSTVSHGLQTPGRGLAGLRASSSAVTDVGDPSEGEPTVFNPRPRVNTTVSAPFGLTTESQIQAALQRTVSVKRQEVEATLEDTQTAAAAATAQNTQVSAVAGMNAVAAAARAAQGSSPETLVSLLEELQRNPQLRQLASAGLLSWGDLLSDKHETLPDGTKVRVVDAKKLLALQQRLSTLAQKEAGKLQNIQQVAVQSRTVPGLKQATPGAIYPGVSVFMYPREMPAGRPGS